MIQLLVAQHGQQLQRLRLLSLESDAGAFASNYEYESQFPTSFYSHKIAHQTQPPFGFYGFFVKETLVAYVQLSQELLPKKTHIAYVYELYVHPDHRRQGIAKQLVTYLVNKAKTQPQLEQLQLRVNANNTHALSFYTSFGFETIATLPKAIKENITQYQDEYLMVFTLQPHSNFHH